MFGDTTTFGVRIGNDTATGGASVSLGYKAQSVALVPITYNDDDGYAKTLKADGRGMSDAMSVFAVFGSSTPEGGTGTVAKVGLGQMFATGLAAQEITTGYICRAQGTACPPTSADAVASAAAAAANTAAAQAQAAAVAASAAAAQVAKAIDQGSVKTTPRDDKIYDPDNGPYQRPLVFMRTDVLGFDIGGALAEKGLQFVLGYTNRNLAFIPTYSKGEKGEVGRIVGGDTAKSGNSKDTLSVFGQFQANTQTAKLGYDLERFFATGVAARNMGTAASVVLAKTPLPPASAASAAK
jgi:hypothetical protein